MNKKKLLAILILFQITLLTANPFIVDALFFSSPKLNAKKQIEEILNVDVEEGIQPLTEGLNSSSRKGQIPEVSIRFSTPNPKLGEKITASADVLGLSNINDAYYVWFLKRDGEGYEDADQLHKNAIRAQVLSYYDERMFDQKFNEGLLEQQKEKGNDSDGYITKMGGDDGIVRENEDDDGKDYCYIYNPKTGVQYEIGDASGGNGACEDGYIARCMAEESTLQCPVLVPAVEIDVSSQASSGSGSSGSSSNATVGGGGGARSNTLTQCLDMDIKAVCDEKTERLACGSVTGISYSYSSPIKKETPFCVKKYSNGQIWVDSNVNGCPSPTGVSGPVGHICLENGDTVTSRASNSDIPGLINILFVRQSLGFN